MLTFTDQIAMAQQMSGDPTAARLLMFKRDINEGAAMFLNRLGRKFNRKYKTANLVANQQYYQFAGDMLRIGDLRCLQGTHYYSPVLVTSEEEWNRINSVTTTGNYPSHIFIRGFNEIGLYPVPSTNVTNGLSVSYEPQHIEVTHDDFTTGTVTVARDSVAITHSGTSFTPEMVGRYFQVTDGTDGKWYRIASYTSGSVLGLENYYEGIDGSRTFRIGEVMSIPNAYQDAPVYYALERFYLMQNDQATAAQFSTRFDMKVKSAKETYGRSTAHMGVSSRPNGRKARWIDLTPPVAYP